MRGPALASSAPSSTRPCAEAISATGGAPSKRAPGGRYFRVLAPVLEVSTTAPPPSHPAPSPHAAASNNAHVDLCLVMVPFPYPERAVAMSARTKHAPPHNERRAPVRQTAGDAATGSS